MNRWLSALLFTSSIFTYQLSWGQAVTNPQHQLDMKRLEYARTVIRELGDKISPDVRENILKQKVTLGMHPNEAYLAAGAFSFKVIADPNKWPANADPFKVMEAQTLRPDESQIWMNFKTATQFAGNEMVSFRVFIKNGTVQEIVEADGAGSVK